MIRKLTKQCVIAALFGALITLAMCFMLALLPVYTEESFYNFASLVERTKMREYVQEEYKLPFIDIPGDGPYAYHFSFRRSPTWIGVYLGGEIAGEVPGDISISYRRIQGVGWPMICALGESSGDRRRWPAAYEQPTGNLQDVLWPTRILPWPFTINALTFALPFLILRFACGAIRHRVRRRRGQCVTCGYSLVGASSLRCPECGQRGHVEALPVRLLL